MAKSFISGCAGLELSDDERAFFRSEDPWGLILFARNIGTPEQVRALTESFRDVVGRPEAFRRDALVVLDPLTSTWQRARIPTSHSATS